LLELDLDEAKAIKIYSRMAMCFDRIGSIDKACELYKKILGLSPLDSNAINNLANLYIRKSAFKEAL
jgi:Flp pilus assembly protein TadD